MTLYSIMLLIAFLVQGLGLYSIFFNNKDKLGFNLLVSMILSGSIIAILFNLTIFLNVSFNYFVISTVILCFFYIRKIKLPRFYLHDRKFIIYILILFITATYSFINQSQRWGKWDAWAIWNAHAKFLYDEQNWSRLFFGGINHSHPDYPLMLPSMVAMLWKAAGGVTPYVPYIIAMFVLFCILLALFSSIINTKFKYLSFVCAALIVMDSHFISIVSSQYSDSLLALYILITTVLIWGRTSNKPTVYVVIGIFASFCIWVKNEGIVYFVLISTYIIYNDIKEKKKVLFYIIGLSPVLVLYIFFKVNYAPLNHIVTEQGFSTFEKLTSSYRYKTILKHLIFNGINNYPLLPFLLAFSLFEIKNLKMLGLLSVLLLTFLGYIVVYIITPYDLDWHLRHSLSRLIHQLYPAILFCFFIILQSKISKWSLEKL